MNRNIFLLFPLLSLIFLSCTRELDIPLPEHESKLVSNSIVESGEIFQVFVARSYALNEFVQQNDIYIKDARVELWKDGQFEEVLTYKQGDTVRVTNTLARTLNNYGYYSEHVAQPGSMYELRVSHPDYPDLSQKMVLPTIPDIASLDFFEDVGINANGERIQRLIVTFQDPADTANHYRLVGDYYELSIDTMLTFLPTRNVKRDWVPIGAPFEFFTPEGYIVPDTDFDGQRVEIGFEYNFLDTFRDLPDTALYEPGYIVLEWQSWNEPAYKMTAEYEEHRDANSVVDSEVFFGGQTPFPMYTNAEGGFGIFGGYTIRRDTIFL